jgi:hypothetical protein
LEQQRLRSETKRLALLNLVRRKVATGMDAAKINELFLISTLDVGPERSQTSELRTGSELLFRHGRVAVGTLFRPTRPESHANGKNVSSGLRR